MNIFRKIGHPKGTETTSRRIATRQTIHLTIRLVYLGIATVTAAAGRQTLCKPSGFDDAMLCCQQLGPSFSLPVISTVKDYLEVVGNMKRFQMNSIWLLLKRTRYSQFTWIDGSPGPELMDDKSNDTNCAEWNFRQKRILPKKCGNFVDVGVLCQVPDCKGCQHMDLSSMLQCVEVKNNCYIMDCTSTIWDGGRRFCLEHSFEYISLSEPNKLKAFRERSAFKTGNCLGAWIGLRRHQWTIIHNISEEHQVTLPYWLPGEPGPFGDCGYMKKHDHGYGWAAASCNKKLSVLCIPNNITTEHVTAGSWLVKNEPLDCQPCKTGLVPCPNTQGHSQMLRTLPAILALCSVTSILLVIFITYFCHLKRNSHKDKRESNQIGECMHMLSRNTPSGHDFNKETSSDNVSTTAC